MIYSEGKVIKQSSIRDPEAILLQKSLDLRARNYSDCFNNWLPCNKIVYVNILLVISVTKSCTLVFNIGRFCLNNSSVAAAVSREHAAWRRRRTDLDQLGGMGASVPTVHHKSIIKTSIYRQMLIYSRSLNTNETLLERFVVHGLNKFIKASL